MYKNELGINILPVILNLSGVNSNSVKGNLIYRRYVNSKNAIRVSLGVYPFQTGIYYDVNPRFCKTVDTFFVYTHREHKTGLKPQLNLGYEFIFRKKRLVHSFGTELYVNYQHTEQKDVFNWAGQHSSFNSTGDLIKIHNNHVDSLESVQTDNILGFGMYAFYNLRIPLSKHWLISTTIGGIFGVNVYHEKLTSNKPRESRSLVYTNFDANFRLSDISICFRF